jgi:hypothetical protein
MDTRQGGGQLNVTKNGDVNGAMRTEKYMLEDL